MRLAEKLWDLRNEICLGSCYVADYENSYEIDADDCCTFFEGYIESLWDIAREEGKEMELEFMELTDEYDTIDNLEEWYLCFEDYPLGEDFEMNVQYQ